MLLIVSAPVQKTVRLPQPDATTVLYVQGIHGFDTYPDDGATLDRVVEVAPAEEREGVTIFRIEHASGARSGADMFHWAKESP
jgi:hypothetical protein